MFCKPKREETKAWSREKGAISCAAHLLVRQREGCLAKFVRAHLDGKLQVKSIQCLISTPFDTMQSV